MARIKLPAVYDISSHDPVVSWPALDPYPDLLITRACYGAGPAYGSLGKDSYYDECAREARTRGYAFWAYAFLLYNEPWLAQADLFLSIVQPGITSDFIPVLDLEGALPQNVSRATANGMVENWLSKVETALQREAVIYSSRYYLSFLYSGEAPRWLKSRYNWMGGYPNNPDLHITMPATYLPTGGVSPDKNILWQYMDTGEVEGIRSRVDCNQYQNNFRPKYPTQAPPLPEPTPEPLPGLYYRVLQASQNVRSGPGTNYADVGDVHRDDIFRALNVGGSDWWIEIAPGKWIAGKYGGTTYLELVT